MVVLFNYTCYKKYMLDYIQGLSKHGHGERRRLAEQINSQTTYISQVLNGENQFSLEQASKISDFWGHNQEERHFFFLLVQLARAGTTSVKKYFEDQIKEVKSKRLAISNRVKNPEGLTERDQHVYYSCWYYSAIHVLVSVPGFGSKETISKHLNLPLSTTSEVLDFLLQTKLIKMENGQYQPGEAHIHLPPRSIQIRRHHTNWRNQSISSIDKNLPDDLHYSVVVSISKEDIVRVKEKVLRLVEETMSVVKETEPQAIQALTIDFFSV